LIMTLNTQTLTASGASAALLAQRLPELGRQLWHAYWRRRSERATIAVLHALGDNVLHDIGIDRSEIESVVRTRSKGRLQRVDPV
jgi:uncharacterized protein YjiS (DUF1127 family)